MADEEAPGNAEAQVGLDMGVVSFLEELQILRTTVQCKQQDLGESIVIFREEQKKFEEILPKLEELETELFEAGDDKAKLVFQEFCTGVRKRSATISEEVVQVETFLEEIQQDEVKVVGFVDTVEKIIEENQASDEVQANLDDMKKEASQWQVEMTKTLKDGEKAKLLLFSQSNSVDVEESLTAWRTTSQVANDLRQDLAVAMKESESNEEELKRKLEESENQANLAKEQNGELTNEVKELTLAKKDLESNSEELNNEVKELTAAKKELESKNEELADKLKEINLAKKDLESSSEELKRKVEDLENEVKSLNEQNGELKSDVKELLLAKEDLESSSEELKRKVEDLENEMKSLNEQNGELKSDVKELLLAKEDLESSSEELKNELKELTLAKKGSDLNSEELTDKLKEINLVKKELESNNEELTRKLKEINLAKNELESNSEELKNELKELTVAKKGSELNIEELSKKLEEAEEQMNSLNHQNDELQIEVQELKTRLSKADKTQRRIAIIAAKLEDGVHSGDEEDEEPSPELRRIQSLVCNLQTQVSANQTAQELLETYASQEKEQNERNSEEIAKLLAKIESDEHEKAEQGKLIDAIKGLLDENEKLAANLEGQNKTLSEDILEERQRVSELRSNVGDMQQRVDDEKQSKREISVEVENLKDRLDDEKARHENSLRRIEELKQQVGELVKESWTKEEKITELATAVEDTGEKLKAERKRNEENERSLMELQNEIVFKDSLLDLKDSEIERVRAEVRGSEKKVDGLEKQLEWVVENNKILSNGLQESQRKVEELEEKLGEANTNKDSERSVRDEYSIRCEMLAKKLELTESENIEMAKFVEITEKNLEEEREKVELCEREIDLLTEELQSEKNKNTENQVIVQDLQEQLSYAEAVDEYNQGIKSSSIENIMEAEQENERLQDQIADLMERLAKKENAIEELVSNYAIEEQVYKEESVKDKLLIDRLREEVEDLRLREIDHDRIREKESELVQVHHKLQNEKTKVRHLEEQITRLEELAKLEDEIEDWRVKEDGDGERTSDKIGAMKTEYQKKKFQQKDEEIQRLANEIDELYEKLKGEQRQVGDRDIIILELNSANGRDLKTIEKLTSELQTARQQGALQRERSEELTDRVIEGQNLIMQLEAMAERERIKAAAMEEVLSSEKGKYTQQMGIVKDLKKKVEEYQKTVGEVRMKVDRINRHMHCGSSHVDGQRPAVGDVTARKLNEKLTEQKTIIKGIKANLSDVEEKNDSLITEIQEQKGKNVEQDEKLQQLLRRSSDNEGLMTDMRLQLEDIKTRYQGLSWELKFDEEDQDFDRDDVASPPPQSPRSLAKYVKSIPEQALSKQLSNFEQLFENIFSEEARRLEEMQNNLQGVMIKNNDFAEMLLQIKGSLEDEKQKSSIHQTEVEELQSKLRRSEVQVDNLISAVEREGNITKELHEEMRVLRRQKEEKDHSIEDLREKLRQEGQGKGKRMEELNRQLGTVTQKIGEYRKLLDESEERCLQLSAALTNEQVKGVGVKEWISRLEEQLHEEQKRVKDITESLTEERQLNDELKQALTIEKLHKAELERQSQNMEERLLEEQEVMARLQRELKDEQAKKKEIENKLREHEYQLKTHEKVVEELREDLETEQKCYKIVSERLQSEQNRILQMESKLNEYDSLMNSDNEMFEELRHRADTESGKRRKLEEELDNERARALELEKKIKELEDDIARNLELFDELRETIEKEKEQSRYLDGMLQEEKQRASTTLEQGSKAALDLEERLLNEMKRSGDLQVTIRQQKDHNYELEKMNVELQRVVQKNENVVSTASRDLNEQKTRNEDLNERVNELQRKLLQSKEQIKALVEESEKEFQVRQDTLQQNQEFKKQLEDLKSINDGLVKGKRELEVINENKQTEEFAAKLQAAQTESVRKTQVIREAQNRLKKAKSLLTARENLLQKTKQVYDIKLADKDVELQKRAKSLLIVKKVFEGLKSEKEREKAAKKARTSGEEQKYFEDAAEIIKDLEKKVHKLKEEVQSKMELAKDLKDDITELRTSKDADGKLLKQRENVHRVISSEVEESEKKRKRLLKLYNVLVAIYNGDEERKSQDHDKASHLQEITGVPLGESGIKDDPSRADPTHVPSPIQEVPIIKIHASEAAPLQAASPQLFPAEAEVHMAEAPVVEEIVLSAKIVSVESGAPMMDERPHHASEDSPVEVSSRPIAHEGLDEAGGPLTPTEEIDSLECFDGDFDTFVGEFGFDEFDKELFKYADSLKEESTDDRKDSREKEVKDSGEADKDHVDGGSDNQPPSDRDGRDVQTDNKRPAVLDWRVVLAGIILTLVLLLLQRVLPPNASGSISALLVIPLMILVSRYEKRRLQKEMKKSAGFLSGDYQELQQALEEKTRQNDLYQDRLEELMVQTEGDANVIQELRNQLEEELAAEEGTRLKLEEVKVETESLLAQEKTIADLSGKMRDLEKAKIDEMEKHDQSHEEYKVLREEIDKLKRDREEEIKERKAKIAELEKLQVAEETNKNGKKVRKLNLPLASLPFWMGLAVVMYQLSGLHVFAPCAIFCLLVVFSANAWYTLKHWIKVIEDERRLSSEQRDELEEVTELLDREYDVVKAQKSAIDMLVKEIEEEQASRKAKQVVLAKLIWQLQEMEGMQTLVLKERRHETGVKDWQTAMRRVAEEKASEKAKIYSNIISKLKEIGADTPEEDEIADDLCEAAKELTKYAEEQIEEVNSLHLDDAKHETSRTRKLPVSWKTVAMVVINTVALGAALVFKSYMAATLVAVQAVLYALQRKRTTTRLWTVTDNMEVLKQKLEREIERNKAQHVENEKLKKLLRTAGRYKRSDEFALEVKERCKKRAQHRQS